MEKDLLLVQHQVRLWKKKKSVMTEDHERYPNAVMSGLNASEEIRRIKEPKGRSDGWIIALTAYTRAGDKEKYLSVGMNDYISKPTHTAQLAEAIGRVVVIWPAMPLGI